MPIITCPKCQGNLKFPDDSPARRVKCPTCGNVFMSSDGLDAKSPSSSSSGTEATKRSGSKADGDTDRRRDDDDDRRTRRRDDDDDDRRSRRRDDDDDDRDRRRRRDDDDDDRDRDRGRSRRRDDDDDDDRDRDRDRGRSRRRDDDDDDRDRDRRRRRDDEDDDDDRDRDRDRRRRKPKENTEGQYNRAGLCCLLNFIGGWLHVAALGISAFVTFLAWCGVTDGLKIFMVIAGLLGIGCWLTSAAGFGIGIAGPRDRGALAFSIATASVAGLHLLFTIIIATQRSPGAFGLNPVGSTVEVSWGRFVTSNGALSNLIFFSIILDAIFRNAMDGAVLPVFTNLAEIARTILFLFFLRSVMLCLREKKAASTCMKTIIGYAIGMGVLILLGLMFGLLFEALRPSRNAPGAKSNPEVIFWIYNLVIPLVLIGLHVWVNLIVRVVKGNIDYRR